MGARSMLLERWSRGQRLTLVAVIAHGEASWHGGVDAEVEFESRLPNRTAPQSVAGKTAISCVARRIFVLSLDV